MVSLQQNALFIRLMFLGLHAYVGKFCLIPGASGRPKIAAVSRNAPAWIAELCPGQPSLRSLSRSVSNAAAWLFAYAQYTFPIPHKNIHKEADP